MGFVSLYVSTEKPRTRLRARILGFVALYVSTHLFFRASGEGILGTLKHFQCIFKVIFFRASGEAVLGTLKYFLNVFLCKFVSRLRRGDFRYTIFVS